LVEYFELKITDNQSDDFLGMLLKNDLPFSYENFRKSYLADLQKTYENLTTNLGKSLRKSYEVSKIGPQNDRHDVGRPQVAMHRNCHRLDRDKRSA